jgi:hypothetical protein
MNLLTVMSRLTAVVCSIVLVPSTVPATRAGPVSQQASEPAQEAPKIPNDQLDALVAPIALYPDPLLAQVLAASTYPLEIMQLQQWLAKNKDLKDKALVDAVAKQPWDSSVQAMAPLPDLVKRLADDIQWATDLGNAFLAQQSDVMDAVQRMRSKAKDTGNLKSNEQMNVETKVIENKSVVVIEQAKPEVVYVPSYNPTVVYGPPVYPYPPISYPPPGYYAAGMALSFGVGVAMGAAWGGGWGNCGWGGNNEININTNNNFNRNTNVTGGSRNTSVGSGNRGGNTGGGWKHNPQHRGGAPYANRSTANKYGGTARGDSVGNRQADARQRQQQGAGDRASGGAGDRGANRAGASDRGGNRPSASSMDSNRGGSGDRGGNRSASSSSRGGGAFGGSSGGASGARSSSSRGASSMGGSRAGGSRGGGGRRR